MGRYILNVDVGIIKEVMNSRGKTSKKCMRNLKMKKAVLISCFNMYKRLMLISEILKKEFDVTILISDFVHHSKKRIEFKYDDYTYIETIPYNKNLSLKRLLSHIDFSRKVLNNIEMIQPYFIY